MGTLMMTSVLLIVLLVFYAIVLLIALVFYVLQAIAMQKMAKLRDIPHGWLAWIPYGNVWLMGSISDHYQQVVKGRTTNRRKILLGLAIAAAVAALVMYVPMIVLMLGAESMGLDPEMISIITAIGMLCMELVLVAIAITSMVFQYISLYDIFMSCAPDSAVLCLVLSILISGAGAIALFINRNKTLGLPQEEAPDLYYITQ
jgi:hypothetical protein